jgi:pimeloyl-ACP methyl ester carboxylesterase
MGLMAVLLIAFAAFVVVWLVSFVVEALRKAPEAPEAMSWAPSVHPAYVTVHGVTLRYVKTGQGPVLVLLHTLRTQLDIFQKVIPELARDFTVYALDFPGHGYSDIPDGPYDANFFVEHVHGFLDELDLTRVTLVGVSIGASISLILAARRNPRIVRIIPINPYDYYEGKGIARGSLLGRVLVSVVAIPVVGETVMRLRNYALTKAVQDGAVSDPASIPTPLMKEMYRVGNRRGHYLGFIKLLRKAGSWERARADYGNINVPTLMMWGAEDWALPAERRYDESLVPGVQSITIERATHLLPLESPAEVIHQIRTWGLPRPDKA